MCKESVSDQKNNMVINVWKDFVYSDIASGVYYDHTVAVFGYKTYTNLRTREKYTFLIIADGWSHNSRYLPWTNTGAAYLGCFTSVTTPYYSTIYK